MLVDYFTGTWANKIKPLELYKKKKGSYPEATRNVPPQPIMLGEGKMNKRKLEELPVHLVGSLQFDEFVQQICRCFKWLYAKCKLFTLTDVLIDLRMAEEAIQKLDSDVGLQEISAEIKQLSNVLIMGADAIRKNADNLAIQVGK